MDQGAREYRTEQNLDNEGYHHNLLCIFGSSLDRLLEFVVGLLFDYSGLEDSALSIDELKWWLILL